jgi:hypothetical protein
VPELLTISSAREFLDQTCRLLNLVPILDFAPKLRMV